MKAKTIIQEEDKRAGLEFASVIAFGSRTQGKARPDSDWDFLIVVDRLPERSLPSLETRIGVRLVQERLPADVLILSESQFDECKNDVGHIAYYAARESIVL